MGITNGALSFGEHTEEMYGDTIGVVVQAIVDGEKVYPTSIEVDDTNVAEVVTINIRDEHSFTISGVATTEELNTSISVIAHYNDESYTMPIQFVTAIV